MSRSNGPTLTPEEALAAINQLRSNMVATQSASWSNMCYPIVAILGAAGLEKDEASEQQQRDHLACYGGAGGFPGYLVGDTRTQYERQSGKPPPPLRGGTRS